MTFKPFNIYSDHELSKGLQHGDVKIIQIKSSLYIYKLSDDYETNGKSCWLKCSNIDRGEKYVTSKTPLNGH